MEGLAVDAVSFNKAGGRLIISRFLTFDYTLVFLVYIPRHGICHRFLLLLSCSTPGGSVHLERGRWVYKGRIHVTGSYYHDEVTCNGRSKGFLLPRPCFGLDLSNVL